MKQDSNTSPEYQRFQNLLRTVVSVPPAEAKRIIEAEKKAKRKKRVKKPASRVSGDRER